MAAATHFFHLLGRAQGVVLGVEGVADSCSLN